MENNLLDNIKLLVNNDKYGLFNGNNGKLYEISKRLYYIINNLKISNISEGNLLVKSENSKIIYKMLNKEENLKNKSENKIDQSNINKKFGKVQLLVTNACNLKCKYCYANEGSYNMPITFMKSDIAIKLLDDIYSKYNTIRNIQFFGGEPLLNIDTIRDVCKYIYEKKDMTALPTIGLNTNLTILNDKIVDVIKKYNINISVSIDGPKSIHDLLRVDKDGRGTYNIVSANIKKLRNEIGQPNMVEATYTNAHLKQGISRKDIAHFINNEYGIKTMIISNVYDINKEENLGIDTEDKDYYQNRIKEALELLDEGILVVDIFESLLNITLNAKLSDYYCYTGLNTIAVMPNGDIYPCQIFSIDSNLYMGNCINQSIYKNIDFIQTQEILKKIRKTTNEKCNSCFAKLYCHPCLASIYNEKGSIDSTLISSSCDEMKRRIDASINTLFKIKLDSSNWNKFISKIHNNLYQLYK